MVLAVIALIVGGMLVGRSLIRSAELQSAISDVSRFKQAAKLFRDKYKYLAGDFPRATEFWGAMSGCPETALGTERTKRTCNGDGDGFIAGSWSTAMWVRETPQQQREPLRAWQHLANAGLIEGAYSGTPAPTNIPGLDSIGVLAAGVNIAAGRIARSGYTFSYWLGREGLDTGVYQGATASPGHIIVFGGLAGYSYVSHTEYSGVVFWQHAYFPVLTAPEAAQIDRRIDDGKPGTGNVRSYPPDSDLGTSSPDCATSVYASSAEYKTDPAAPILGIGRAEVCALIFLTGL